MTPSISCERPQVLTSVVGYGFTDCASKVELGECAALITTTHPESDGARACRMGYDMAELLKPMAMAPAACCHGTAPCTDLSSFAVTGLLRAGNSLQATAPAPADVKCDPKRVVSSADCDKAWAKIKYEPDSTLFKDSGHIERISGNCVVSPPLQLSVTVVKTAQTIVNKPTVEDGFKKMIARCKNSARLSSALLLISIDGAHYAYYPLPGLQDAHLAIRPRAKTFPIEDDAAFNEPVCLDMPDVPKAEKADCMEAYKALTTNSDGHFVDASKAPINVVVTTVKTCKVSPTLIQIPYPDPLENYGGASTHQTFQELPRATKHDLDSIFGKMLDKCNGKWAAVPIEKGAAGAKRAIVFDSYASQKALVNLIWYNQAKYLDRCPSHSN
ncbi:hypothetical protein PSTT_09349, partial [Puccinia striiformis]